MVGDKRISRSIEFEMTGAAERKEREPKLVLDGVGTMVVTGYNNKTTNVKP